jgi:hypothetical protein
MTEPAPLLSDQLKAQAEADTPLQFRQPQNVDAERLGAILVNNEALDRVRLLEGRALL